MTILMIVLLFLLAGAILTASVVHDVTTRAGSSGWEEEQCANSTQEECEALRCPVTGWRLSEEDRMCSVLPGYSCCTTCTGHLQCFSQEQAANLKCCFATGIVPSAYKNTCHKGFVWVAWKRLCVRKN